MSFHCWITFTWVSFRDSLSDWRGNAGTTKRLLVTHLTRAYWGSLFPLSGACFINSAWMTAEQKTGFVCGTFLWLPRPELQKEVEPGKAPGMRFVQGPEVGNGQSSDLTNLISGQSHSLFLVGREKASLKVRYRVFMLHQSRTSAA